MDRGTHPSNLSDASAVRCALENHSPDIVPSVVRHVLPRGVEKALRELAFERHGAETWPGYEEHKDASATCRRRLEKTLDWLFPNARDMLRRNIA